MTQPEVPLKKSVKLRDAIRVYADRRLWIIFLLGFSSGFPWVLIGSAMTAWLQESGLTRTAIGFFGSIFAAYTFNFLWAPLLDRFRLPLLHRVGQRKSWILFTQSLVFFGALAISQTTDPKSGIVLLSLIALAIAVASATQDISIDAYRIEIIPAREAEKIPAGAAMATSGWWAGYSLPGALAFWAADWDGWNWSRIYLLLAFVMCIGMLIVLLIPEPESQREKQQHEREEDYQHKLGNHSRWDRLVAWLAVTVIEPFREFFSRNGAKIALAILGFIFLFKIGEAFLGRMSIVFYKEIGFTNTEIGTYSKLIGWWVTILFSVIGGILNARFGILRGLLIGGIAMAASNLMFSLIAVVGPDKHLFLAAIIVDGFTSAFATVTFVAFISSLTSRTWTASQYALMASVGNFGRTLLSSTSGAMVDFLDGNWALFFALTALMVIPSLLLLVWIGHKFHLSFTHSS